MEDQSSPKIQDPAQIQQTVTGDRNQVVGQAINSPIIQVEDGGIALRVRVDTCYGSYSV